MPGDLPQQRGKQKCDGRVRASNSLPRGHLRVSGGARHHIPRGVGERYQAQPQSTIDAASLRLSNASGEGRLARYPEMEKQRITGAIKERVFVPRSTRVFWFSVELRRRQRRVVDTYAPRDTS